MIFTALVALFIVDKTIAWKINLISPEQNKELFDLIKTLVLMIFSYYFGTKEKSSK
jgi:phosphate starvation-inducible membrane PsiE